MLEREQWFIKNRRGDVGALSRRLGVSRHLAGLLIGRSVGDAARAREFLEPDVGLLHDAAQLMDMDRALEILARAAASGTKVLVIGDYDVDGIMGILILCAAFGKAFPEVSHYIPHRVDDGYGINEKIVENAHRDGVGLIVTCDNGISAHESVRLAVEYGIEVVITDHHDVPLEDSGVDAEGYGIPAAHAVVDPKRPDCPYPFKGLCGAAVAYKLAIAFLAHMAIEISPEERDELFCFAAIATVCDIVELVDENRRIVYHGLKLLNAGVRNAGLFELIDVCGLARKELTSYGIGHILGPCINAAGRLDSAELSYRLFAERDHAAAREIAISLLELNRKRQEITSEALEAAIRAIEEQRLFEDSVVVLYMPRTHESISGIVAGKLKDKYARPVIVLTDSKDGLLKGSGRSVDGYNLLEGVSRVRGLLHKFGGHSMAVGISVCREALPELRLELNRKCGIASGDLVPKEVVDLCVNAEEVSFGLICDVRRLEPFGRGNLKPLFALRGVTLESAVLIGSRRSVIRMRLRSVRDRYMEAVFFGEVGVFAKVLGLTALEDGTLVAADIPGGAQGEPGPHQSSPHQSNPHQSGPQQPGPQQ
ncbi:MAG: single-stranded-DNA-specific exonuclease RecJ, partial [Clostridiales bacterium]|nr:single-stranded-DNA-specific exonuclease RecJ [Clostridiales bacterium]